MRSRRLHQKLALIRSALGFSQNQMATALSAQGRRLGKAHISLFESDKREPSTLVLLDYARLVGVCMEVLVDDELDLPKDLPARKAHKPL